MADRENHSQGQLDVELGRLALERGLITPQDLKEALVDQSRDAAGGGRPRPLGAILVAQGRLLPVELDLLLESPRKGAATPDGDGGEDARLGRHLIQRKWATPDQVNECLRLQAEAAGRGQSPPPRLGELLVAKGHVTTRQVSDVLAGQQKTILVCAACGKRYNVARYDPSREYACRSCQGTLDPLASLDTIRVDETAIFTPPAAASSAARPAVPACPPFGKYTLVRELGRGGMGVVYEAIDAELRRRIALKTMLPNPHADAQETQQEEERFVREATLSAKLTKHANVVTVYEAGVVEGKRYIAMEYIAGASMADWRQTGSVTVRRQVALLRTVALAIHHAHEHGIIHRDLKPANVLVDRKGQPHVSDFGLAKKTGQNASLSLTASGMVVGTPAYMSPEQAQGLKTIDRRTDVWSLGVMLYEILTGRVPFVGDSPIEILMKAVKNPVPPPSVVARGQAHLDGTIEKICLKALAKRPKDRYPTAEAFARDLTRWLKGEEVRVTVPRSREPAGSRGWLYGLGAGAAVAVCVLILWPSRPATDSARAAQARQEAQRKERGRIEQEKAEAVSAATEEARQKAGDEARAREDLLRQAAEQARLSSEKARVEAQAKARETEARLTREAEAARAEAERARREAEQKAKEEEERRARETEAAKAAAEKAQKEAGNREKAAAAARAERDRFAAEQRAREEQARAAAEAANRVRPVPAPNGPPAADPKPPGAAADPNLPPLARVEVALVADDFTAARKALSDAAKAGAGAADEAALRALSARLSFLQQWYKKVEPSRRTLQVKPDDPSANLAIGKYECFAKRNWQTGLPLLVKSSDAALKTPAALDLSGPAGADGFIAAGDSWWGVADKAKGAERAAMRFRAAGWYARAFVTGLPKAPSERLLARMDAVAAEMPPAECDPSDRWFAILKFDGATLNGFEQVKGNWTVQGGNLVSGIADAGTAYNQYLCSSRPGRWARVILEFKGGNPGLYFTPVKGPGASGANLGQQAEFNESGKGVPMDRWNVLFADFTAAGTTFTLNGEFYHSATFSGPLHVVVKAQWGEFRAKRLIAFGPGTDP